MSTKWGEALGERGGGTGQYQYWEVAIIPWKVVRVQEMGSGGSLNL